MVDANQGWRMPGDLTPRWDVSTATQFARRAGAPRRLLARGAASDLGLDGYARARRKGRFGSRRARWFARRRGTRLSSERGGVDVVQPDVVLSGGIDGARRIVELAERAAARGARTRGRTGTACSRICMQLSPFSTCPYLEVPFDPPAWSAERRDWLLPVTLEIAPDGTIGPPDGPGLGVVPDFDALERYRIG